MKTMNYKVIALTVSGIFLLSGCETMQKATTAMGPETTGVLAGLAAGAGTGIACDKLTGGKNTGACVAAGMAVGAAVGVWAASIDETVAKQEPPRRCKEVKQSMNYSKTAKDPIAILKLDTQKSLVAQKGSKFLAPVIYDLATPGKEGYEEAVAIKVDIDVNKKKSSVKITPECGGQANLPVILPTTEVGTYMTTITMTNAADSKLIQGGTTNFTYTVVAQ